MGSFTATVPSHAAGATSKASKLQTLDDLATALTAAWTTHTPTWTASAGTPAIGNGTLTGRYRLIGKTLNWQVQLVAGSTTTYGTAGANWGFTMPLSLIAAADAVFSWHAVDVGILDYVGVGRIQSGLTSTIFYKTPSGVMTNTSPWTFGTADELRFSATIEVT